jgi:hypothetical protein
MTISISSFPKDINDKVSYGFEKDEQNAIFEMLTNLNIDVKSLKILRCIIYLSKGNFEYLKYYCERARTDYRDVIYWSEYDNSDLRVRDFDMPFSKNED